tara:strand:- start:23 stop:199 length:177 start_codon:yes stop_codon:yes gene_type:complete
MNKVLLTPESYRQLKELAPRKDDIGISSYLIELIGNEFFRRDENQKIMDQLFTKEASK